MNSERRGWRRTTLGEITELLPGFAFESHRYSEADTDIRLLRGDNVAQGRVRWDGAKRWPASDQADHAKYELRTGDVVLAMDRPWIEAGLKVAVLRPHDVPALLVQRVARLRAERELDQAFLGYLVADPRFTQYVRSVQTGTAVPHISGAQIQDYGVDLPPMTEQRRIAWILGSFEHKIENNRRMAKTLEGIGSALFMARFVDFVDHDDLVDGELGPIPKGWHAGVLGDVLVQRVDRCQPSDETAILPYLPIDAISSRSLFLMGSKPGTEAKSSLTRFSKYDLVFGAMRPYFHKVCIAPFAGVTRTTAFVLAPMRPGDFSFATLQLHRPETIDYATRQSTGSTIPYAKWNDSLAEMPIVVPPAKDRDAFNGVCRPFLDKIVELHFETQTLQRVRDALVPKLISGQIRMPEDAGPGPDGESPTELAAAAAE